MSYVVCNRHEWVTKVQDVSRECYKYEYFSSTTSKVRSSSICEPESRSGVARTHFPYKINKGKMERKESLAKIPTYRVRYVCKRNCSQFRSRSKHQCLRLSRTEGYHFVPTRVVVIYHPREVIIPRYYRIRSTSLDPHGKLECMKVLGGFYSFCNRLLVNDL